VGSIPIHLRHFHMNLLKIVSGGQTGADRAGLDWAIANGFEHGGWCPKGRAAEDGPIASRYQLQETPTSDSEERTEWNVRDSDGTVIFSVGEKLSEGSLLTLVVAVSENKPCIHLSAAAGGDAAQTLREFIGHHHIHVLNVAGPRASKEPGVADFVTRTLGHALR
jgi:hypothetical protein